jgi:hypothetical protein
MRVRCERVLNRSCSRIGKYSLDVRPSHITTALALLKDHAAPTRPNRLPPRLLLNAAAARAVSFTLSPLLDHSVSPYPTAERRGRWLRHGAGLLLRAKLLFIAAIIAGSPVAYRRALPAAVHPFNSRKGWTADMPKIILVLLMTACATSPLATRKRTLESQRRKFEIACYNVITGRTFSAANVTFSIAVARTDQADNIPEREFVMAIAMGPAFVREMNATGTMRFLASTSRSPRSRPLVARDPFGEGQWN